MIKVAICSDGIIAGSQIERIVLELCGEKGIPVEADVFYSGESLRKEIKRGERYDLLYLDFRTGDEEGVVTAGDIRKLDEDVLIIYVSACDNHMIELFRFNIFAFIRRPVDAELFKKLFLEANQKICNNNVYFTFHYRGEEYKLPYREILYFESMGKRIRVNLRNGDAEIFVGKLSEVAEKVERGKIPFLRIHQSYLVNYYLIKSRSRTEVTLINGTKLPISGDRKKMFNHTYGMLLGE